MKGAPMGTSSESESCYTTGTCVPPKGASGVAQCIHCHEEIIQIDGQWINEDPHCNKSGRCSAPAGARDITNCIYCGKELHEKDGEWWTWDADQCQDPQPQGRVE